jgi:hypothetical protein
MGAKEYNSEEIKKIVRWLDEHELKMKHASWIR